MNIGRVGIWTFALDLQPAHQAQEAAAWAKSHQSELVELYRHFHLHPELSFEERETGARVAKELRVSYEAGVITEVLKDTRLKSDPIHPNAAGYRLIAEQMIAEVILPQ